MGVLYSVFPVNDKIRDWLQSENINCPAIDGQFPTRSEITTVLDGAAGLATDYSQSGQRLEAIVTDTEDPTGATWTLIQIPESDLSPFCELYFEKGCPQLIARILYSLTKVIGPVTLVPDTGCAPLVIHCGIDLQSTLASWEHLAAG